MSMTRRDNIQIYKQHTLKSCTYTNTTSGAVFIDFLLAFFPTSRQYFLVFIYFASQIILRSDIFRCASKVSLIFTFSRIVRLCSTENETVSFERKRESLREQSFSYIRSLKDCTAVRHWERKFDFQERKNFWEIFFQDRADPAKPANVYFCWISN